MKVFVEFEALCKDIYLEEILTSIRFSKKQDKQSLLSMPYNGQTLSILSDHYKDKEIVILAKEKMNKYSGMIERDLKNDFNFNVSFKYYNSFEEKSNAIESNSAFITNNVLQGEIYDKTKENSFSGEMISSFFFWLIAPNKKENQNSFFQGALLMPLEYLQIIIPLFCCWPSLFSSSIAIDQSRIIFTIVGTILSCSAAGILREILEIPNERYHYFNGYKPLCSENFIKHNYSPKIAFLYFIGFTLLNGLIFYYDYVAAIGSVINGFVFFSTYLFPFWLRIIVNLGTIIFSTLFITQTEFLKYLFLGTK